MKMANKLIFAKQLMLTLVMVSFCCFIFAQPDDNDGDPPANDVPIDGGVSLLLAAGAAYVAKKSYDKRKKLSEENNDVSKK